MDKRQPNSLENNTWGKDKNGKFYLECERCGSTKKPHFARGFCKSCYNHWLADNNPIFKEKLKKRKREQKKRYRQSESYKLKKREKETEKRIFLQKQKQKQREKQLAVLKNKYYGLDNLIKKQEKLIKEKSEEEKKKYPAFYKYVLLLKKRINYYPVEERICPLCKTKWLFEYKRKSPIRSSLTNYCCPKCHYEPQEQTLCLKCETLIPRSRELCSKCSLKLSKLAEEHVHYTENFCIRCGKVATNDFGFGRYNVWGKFETLKLCKDCSEKSAERFGLAGIFHSRKYSSQKIYWIKIETDEPGGDWNISYAKLLCVPYSTIHYLSYYINGSDFLLNLKLKLGLTFTKQDFGILSESLYRLTDFANRYQNEILDRFNLKVFLWEKENKMNFLEYISKDLPKRNMKFVIMTENPNNRPEPNRYASFYNVEAILTEQEIIDFKKAIESNLLGVTAKREEENISDEFLNYFKRRRESFVKVFFSSYEFLPLYQSPKFKELIYKLLEESENAIRFEMGVPAKGEGWVSETELYQKVKKLGEEFGLEVIHHAKLRWLGKQHLDIFVPELKIAIEYQGTQHTRPVDFFGGEKAFIEVRKKDKKKKELCENHGIDLFYIFENDEKVNSAIDRIKNKFLK